MDDFESLPEFQALVVAAAGKPERRMGDSVIPAEPPQWPAVFTMASGLAEEHARQLPLQVYLVKAATNTQGFPGLNRALHAMLELLKVHWDDIYPAADLDDPDDMYFERINLMRELTDQPAFLDAIYRLPLVSARGIGEFSTRDVDIALGLVNESDEEKARCQEGLIRGAFAESDREAIREQAASLHSTLDACKSIENVFSEKTGQAHIVNMGHLYDRVQACQERFSSYAQDYLSEPETTDACEPQQSAPREVSPPATTTSSLMSRAQVSQSFEAILQYYQRCEPSSPVRVLTLRAREFVDKPFFDAIQALAPATTSDLAALLGELQRQPLASLLNDSYSRFLQGEALPHIAELDSDAAANLPTDAQASLETVVETVVETTVETSTPSADVAIAGNTTTVPVIESRADVVRVLQDIESFFLTNEPSSPIPLIIADIRKLVDRRFSELVDEFSRIVVSSAQPAE